MTALWVLVGSQVVSVCVLVALVRAIARAEARLVVISNKLETLIALRTGQPSGIIGGSGIRSREL